MTAQERLAAALHEWEGGEDHDEWRLCGESHHGEADAILAADPDLAADIEQASALRTALEQIVRHGADCCCAASSLIARAALAERLAK